jgi:uncharacterized repeat protein (TIGR03803 family)
VDGYIPYGSLIADASGNHLYGTTYQGGANTFGEVFELTNSGGTWTQTVIYSFTGVNNGDGAYPFGGLVLDASGKNLYGTTYQGGASSQGTVFQLTNSGGTWKETVLHTFDDISGSDGYYPYGALTSDASGNLYGTTQAGGKFGGGSVFQLKAANGKFTYKVIHSFATSSSTAYYPYAGVVVGKNGYLYGTTYYGGLVWNAGAVYQMRQVSNVWIFTVIYNFLGDSLGQYAESGLAVDAAGNMYGTVYQGGDFNLGGVYKLTAGTNNKWTQKIIYIFKGYAKKDGAYPYFAGVTLDANGNVYGTTYQGGSSAANNLNYGTVFKLAAGTFKESVLWSFGTSGDGVNPYHGTIFVNGKVYGTTNGGGTHGGGTLFQVTP